MICDNRLLYRAVVEYRFDDRRYNHLKKKL